MTTSRWSYLCVVGVLLACVDAQSSLNQTIVSSGNASEVTTTVPSSTASMDATSSTPAPSSVNGTTPMPSSTNNTSSSSSSGGSVVAESVEQPPSIPPPPPPAQPNLVTDGALDGSLNTSENWMPGNFPPPGLTSAADSGNPETTTPSTTPLTIVEVGNPTIQNDMKDMYHANGENNQMSNDAPAESQSPTKESTMGSSTVTYSKDAPSAQQKPNNGIADTRQVHIPLLAVSFILALLCSSRM